MDRGAWWATVHGVAKSQTWLSDFTFTFHFHALEKEMATHSSILAWRIPGTEEPGGLPSMGSHRVRHDWSDLAAAAAAETITNILDYSCHETIFRNISQLVWISFFRVIPNFKKNFFFETISLYTIEEPLKLSASSMWRMGTGSEASVKGERL